MLRNHMKIWTTSTVGIYIMTIWCYLNIAAKSLTCCTRSSASNNVNQVKSTQTGALASSTMQKRQDNSTGTHRKYHIFFSYSRHRGLLATDKRMTPTINTYGAIAQHQRTDVPNGNFLLSAWTYWSRRPLSYSQSTPVPGPLNQYHIRYYIFIHIAIKVN